jgi:hypothetical protein
MVKCGVFFAVRTELLNIILMSFGFKRLNSNSSRHAVCGMACEARRQQCHCGRMLQRINCLPVCSARWEMAMLVGSRGRYILIHDRLMLSLCPHSTRPSSPPRAVHAKLLNHQTSLSNGQPCVAFWMPRVHISAGRQAIPRFLSPFQSLHSNAGEQCLKISHDIFLRDFYFTIHSHNTIRRCATYVVEKALLNKPRINQHSTSLGLITWNHLHPAVSCHWARVWFERTNSPLLLPQGKW